MVKRKQEMPDVHQPDLWVAWGAAEKVGVPLLYCHPIQPLPRATHQEIAAPLLASASENLEDMF